MADKLKPCPFCGCTAKIVYKGRTGKSKVKIECADCWAETKWHWDMKEAVKEWNDLKDMEQEVRE